MQTLGFVFPGQGSQSLGMLNELANEFHHINETFNEGSEVLGYDLWQIVQQGPEARLNQTEYTQPALLTASVAIWRIWKSQNGPLPSFLAGHSLGEYSALVCAESISYKDAIRLVSLRGKLMQSAVEEGQGAMAAIVGLEEALVDEVCQKANTQGIVDPANYNSIGQIVISGQVKAVNYAVELAKSAGAKLAKILPVSVPSHCKLMKPAAEQLESSLSQIDFHLPKIPVVQNVDVATYFDEIKIREALVKQLYSPVRWVETIQFMALQGINIFIECGPGKVLGGLIKRIEASAKSFTTDTPQALKIAKENINFSSSLV